MSIRSMVVERQSLPTYVSTPEYPGVAWSVCYWDVDWDVPFETVNCIMVGDDRKFEFDIDDLDVLDFDKFCSGCGQIGCAHG